MAEVAAIQEYEVVVEDWNHEWGLNADSEEMGQRKNVEQKALHTKLMEWPLSFQPLLQDIEVSMIAIQNPPEKLCQYHHIQMGPEKLELWSLCKTWNLKIPSYEKTERLTWWRKACWIVISDVPVKTT